MTSEYNDEVFELWVLIGRTRDMLRKVRKKELSPYGITPKHAAALEIIYALGDKATPTEVGRWLSLKRHSSHELLTRMEKAGLVRKVYESGRRRKVRFELTDRGLELYGQVNPLWSMYKILASLSKEKQRQLSSYLHVLRNLAMTELGIKDDLPLIPPNYKNPKVTK